MSSELKRTVSSKVPNNYTGKSLLDYLSTRYAYHSREKWTELINAEKLKVNSETGVPGTVLNHNDIVDYLYEGQEPEVNKDFSILYEDDEILVINKPGDLPVHPAGKFFNNTLWAELKKTYSNIHFINRIDRETSGVVLVALNADAASFLGKCFQDRNVTKEYLALVEGRFPQEVTDALGYLEKDPQSEIRKKLFFKPDNNYEIHGKNGVNSSFSTIKEYGPITLIKCLIKTGKTHQIRATLNSLGFPIVGDKLYGINEKAYLKFIKKTLTEEDRQELRMDRQALHASSLQFIHPSSKKSMTFKAPLPEDFKKLIEAVHG